ncbi:type I-E CRISPR-associated protein Cse1/CasA [Thiothrix subterranea]|uniref:Type I-E CRISPR-associated protein Cse1/CasA n=1 Tax=Thiothrix subterranea TaxID=2735563 RepID=A0AA51QZ13_9GAMM|nr:type I-E CRISPR-associated protein Cse1/CasA [Thiothrix subterranea]MDQ5767361.1 type I-E CRISPR-associated protein Cse1/CasA [Thiothrix subterranea]WML88778.1 type I-E CRISPR-associated protein Cse1/CasA [Thiothrix subterranea]
MNLLTDSWIPVRPQAGGAGQQISLPALLCGSERWELALPRDDMELAALQLLISLVQVLLPPTDKKQWAERVAKPLSVEAVNAATKDYQEWFQLDHPEYPFMQVKKVAAKDPTPMDKLLAGLNSSTNSRFVNEPDLAKGLCFGCVAVALYNLANNAPSFGGGFKYGVRGSCPVSTFAQGTDLRSTIWLNVLSQESLDEYIPDWKAQAAQPPTWVEPIKEKATIPAHSIGFLRGLLWQPGHTVLSPPEKSGQCSCCGHEVDKLFTSFNKAKFNYTIDGLWEHPHSPQVLTLKQGNTETRYVSFTQPIPAWTQLSRYVVKREVGKGEQGQKPAMVIQQLQKYLQNHAGKFELLVGGYRNNQAAIIERRHEVLTLSQGWETHAKDVHELVAHGLKYKTALRKVLFVCSEGIKEKDRKLKGTGLKLQEVGETQFYRRSEHLMTKALADIDFSNTLPTFVMLDKGLKKICEAVFTELTTPYEHDPELFRTLAITRRSLQKHIREIRINPPQEDAA